MTDSLGDVPDALAALSAVATDEVRLLGPEHGVPLPTLLVTLGADADGQERYLTASVVPNEDGVLEELELLQLYAPLGVPGDANAGDVDRLLAEVNLALPVGAFCWSPEDGIVLRHVHAMPQVHPADPDALVELVELFTFVHERYGQVIADVAAGRTSLAEARADLTD